MNAWTSATSAGVGVRPVPIAQTGSYATTKLVRRGSVGQRPVELTPDNLQSLAGFTLGALFADTDNGGQPRAPGRLRFRPHLRIGLVMVGAPFGMADDDRARSGIGQHLRGNVAGVGARRLGVTVLSADRSPASRARLRQMPLSRWPADKPSVRPCRQDPLAPEMILASSLREAASPFIFQLPATSGIILAAAIQTPFPRAVIRPAWAMPAVRLGADPS